MKTLWTDPDGLPILRKMPPGISADYELETCFYTTAKLHRLHAAIGEAIEQERVAAIPVEARYGHATYSPSPTSVCPACADAVESMAAPPAKLMDGFVAMFPNLLRPGRDYNVAENKSGTLIVKRPRADEVEDSDEFGEAYDTVAL